MQKAFNLTLLVAFSSLAIFSCKKSNINTPGNALVPASVSISVLPHVFPQTLASINFSDDNTGYAGDYTGGIYKTLNGGLSWSAQTSGVNSPICGIAFLDNLKGFAVGGTASCITGNCTPAGGFILQTIDGGQNWVKILSTVSLNDIYFINNTTGFALGLYGDIYKTINGGQTWGHFSITNFSNSSTSRIRFGNTQKGYIACLYDKVAQTNNATDWYATNLNTGEGFYDIAAGDNYVYMAGQGKMIKSIDNGATWNMLTNSPMNVFSLHFWDANTGIAFGTGNYTGGDFGYFRTAMYMTTDGGQTWIGSSNITDYKLPYQLTFPSTGVGYGTNGIRVIKITAN